MPEEKLKLIGKISKLVEPLTKKVASLHKRSAKKLEENPNHE